MSVRILDEPADAGVEEAWRDLAVSRGNAFVTPEWFHCWRRSYGDLGEPMVAVASGEAGSVRGVLPLVHLRAGPVRVLRFAGFNLGDHFHPAAAESDEAEVSALAAEALRSQGAGRAFLLDHVESENEWVRSLAGGAGAVAGRGYRDDVLPLLRFEDGDWDAYLAGRSRNLRSQVRRKGRALEKEFEVNYRRTTDPAELESDVSSFVRLHESRWQGRGGSGAMSERSRAFLADFAAVALERDWLRLWLCELGGEPVAAWYGWHLGGRYSYYLAGFDPAYGEKSVGFVLLARTIRAAIEEGAAEYDMLRGDEAYKSRFATEERQVRTVGVAPRYGPSRLALGIEPLLWRAARRMPSGIGDRARAVYRALDSAMPGGRRR